jgi:hypothetical protein
MDDATFGAEAMMSKRLTVIKYHRTCIVMYLKLFYIKIIKITLYYCENRLFSCSNGRAIVFLQ